METVKKQALATQRGMTLVELMIVIGIIGILAAMAYPQYTDYIRKARRTAATSALVQAQVELEKRYGQVGSYTGAVCGTKGSAGVVAPCRTSDPDSSAQDYQITVAVTGNGRFYDVTAAPIEGTRQTNDSSCQLFRIDESNERFAQGENADGEVVTTTGECW